MKKPQQRRIVLVVACLSAGALVLLALVCRDDLARYYHLHCLREDPSLLEGMLLGGVNEQAAARRFIKEAPGQEALFRLYLEEFDRGQPGFSNQDYLERLKRGDTTHGSLSLWPSGYSCQSSTGRSGGSSFSLGSVPQDPDRRELILELLDACVGRVFRIESLPHLEFQIRPVVDGEPEMPVWPDAKSLNVRPAPVVRSGVRHICFFRVRS